MEIRTTVKLGKQILAWSRYFIIVAVAGSFVAATLLMLYGGGLTASLASTIFHEGIGEKGAKVLALHCIELVDIFLLGTVFYIIALGLFELFIAELPLPHWLVIKDLDDLKSKLIGVVVVVMGVSFLGQVVTWDGQRDLLGYGAGIAFVIASLTLFVSQSKKKAGGEADGPGENASQ
jgi:uncharacterized membrane protein YqhA